METPTYIALSRQTGMVRDMTPDECAKLTRTYRWTLTRDDRGELLTIPFEDGSKFEYRRAERQ